MRKRCWGTIQKTKLSSFVQESRSSIGLVGEEPAESWKFSIPVLSPSLHLEIAEELEWHRCCRVHQPWLAASFARRYPRRHSATGLTPEADLPTSCDSELQGVFAGRC